MLQEKITEPGLIMKMVAPFVAAKPFFKTLEDEQEAIQTAARIYKNGDARELEARKFDAEVEKSWLKMQRNDLLSNIYRIEHALQGTKPQYSAAVQSAFAGVKIMTEDGSEITGTDVLAFLETREVLDDPLDIDGDESRNEAEERLNSLYEDLAVLDARINTKNVDDSYRQKLGWIGWALANIERIKLAAEGLE